MKNLLLATAAATLLAGPGNAFAAGDAAKGKAVFKRCVACHFVDKEKNKVGPHLVGIVGRKAGTADKFKYSKNLMEEAGKGLVWTEANLDKYLENPKAMLPKGKMAFAGLAKKADRDNLIAYLAEAGKKK